MDQPVRAAISGIGFAVPKRVMHNSEFETFLDTSDEWIAQRTGIRSRHVSGKDETSASLAIEAARMALANAKVSPDELDLILVCTVTPEMIFPATACFVQAALGVKKHIPAFDIAAACSGFVYGLSIVSKFIETGTYKKVLLIGSETLTKFSDYTDRGSCILFGDAAGAVVMEPTTDPNRGVQYTTLYCDGSGWDFITVPGGGSRNGSTHDTVDQRMHYVKMRGREVYKFAVEKMQSLLGECMAKCNLTVDTVDMVVPHQVNLRIIESATQKFHFPMDKVYVNIDRFGNSSSASIPVAMAEAWSRGKIGPGSTIVMVAFGAGLTWAGAVVKL